MAIIRDEHVFLGESFKPSKVKPIFVICMYVLAKLAAFVSKIPVGILTGILEDKELSVPLISAMIIYNN